MAPIVPSRATGKRKRPSEVAPAPSDSTPVAGPSSAPKEVAFASADAIVRALAATDTVALGHAVRQLGKACSIRPVPSAVNEYLKRTPVAQEVLGALRTAQDANSVHLLAACFQTLSSLLNLLPSSSTSGPALVRSVVSDHSTAVSRSFVQGRSEATAAALVFLTTAAEWSEGVCAKEVWNGMRWDRSTVVRLTGMRGIGAKDAPVKNKGAKSNVRFLFLQFVFKLLSATPLALETKVELLRTKGLFAGFFKDLVSDDYDFVAYFLSGVWETLIRDEAWSSRRKQEGQDARWGVWDDEAVEGLVKLLNQVDVVASAFEASDGQEAETVASLAHRFLEGFVSKLASTRGGQYRHSQRILAVLIRSVSPTQSVLHQDLSLHMITLRPSLCATLWRRHAPTEPSATIAWIASVGFGAKAAMLPFRLPLASSEHQSDPPSASGLLAQCLPPSLSKAWYSKTLHNGNNLVSFCGLSLLVAGLRKAAAIIAALEAAREREEESSPEGKWTAVLARFREEVRAVVPEPSQIVAVLQKAPGMALEHFSSIGGTTAGGAADDEDTSLSVDLVSVNAFAALSLYQEVLPNVASTSLRFDYAKVAPIFLPPTIEPTSALAQLHILSLIRGASVTASTPPSSTLLTALLTLSAKSPLETVRDVACQTLVKALTVWPAFLGCGAELRLWLNALRIIAEHDPASANPLVKLLDSCFRSCLKAPLQVLESAPWPALVGSAGGPRSPLLAPLVAEVASSKSSQEHLALFADVLLFEALGSAITLDAISEPLQHLQRAGLTLPATSSALVILGLTGKTRAPIWPPALQNAFSLATAVVDLVRSKTASAKANGVATLDVPPTTKRERVHALRILLHALVAAKDAKGREAVLGIAEDLVTDRESAIELVRDARVGNLFSGAGSDSDKSAQSVIRLILPHLRDGDRAVEAAGSPLVDRLLAVKGGLRLAAAAPLLPFCGPTPRQRLLQAICAACASGPLDATKSALVSQALAVGLKSESWMNLVSPPTPEVVKGLVAVAASGAGDAAFATLQLIASSWCPHSADAGLQRQMMAAGQLCLRVQSDSSLSTLAILLRKDDGILDLVTRSRLWSSLPTKSAGALALVCSYLLTPRGTGTDLVEYSEPLTRLVSGPLFGPSASESLGVRKGAAALLPILSERSLLDVDTLQAQLSLAGLYATFAEGVEGLVGCGDRLPPGTVGEHLAQSLRWLVRRYAEDDDIDSQTSELSAAFREALMKDGDIALPVHLAEPVVSVILQRWLSSRPSLDLAAAVVRHSGFSEGDVLRLLRSVVTTSAFSAALDPTDAGPDSLRPALVTVLLDLTRRSPLAASQADLAAVLARQYHGSLDPADVGILSTMRLIELETGRSAMTHFHAWKPPSSPPGHRVADVLTAFDSSLMYQGCLAALGQRPLTAYDPDFVLPLYGSLLARERLSTSTWQTISRTHLVGLLVCATASPRKSLRLMADRLLDQTLESMKSCRTPEVDELTLPLEQWRNASVDTLARPRPLLALFVARALAVLGSPHSDRYIPVSQYLLSRPLLDEDDVPMLYSMLFSSADASAADQRWILELMRDGLLTSQDWKALSKRQVHEIGASIAMSSADHQAVYLQLLERACRHPTAARQLLQRSGICGLVERIPLDQEAQRSATTGILTNLSKALPNVAPDCVHEFASSFINVCERVQKLDNASESFVEAIVTLLQVLATSSPRSLSHLTLQRLLRLLGNIDTKSMATKDAVRLEEAFNYARSLETRVPSVPRGATNGMPNGVIVISDSDA